MNTPVLAMGLSAVSLLLFYAVMITIVVMLWKLTKELASIKRALADLQQTVESRLGATPR
jgi:uncharacterized metal-binding protein